MSEVLRPGFVELLKPGGTIIMNDFRALPVGVKKEDYPDMDRISEVLNANTLIRINANQVAAGLGDVSGKTAKVVVLGLLSSIPPFNCIPGPVWLSALMDISPGDFIKTANRAAFEAGAKMNIKR